MQYSSPIAITGGNMVIWVVEVNLSLKEKKQG